MAVVASETYTSVSAPIQFAAVQAFKGGTDIEEYLWHVRKILSALGNECARSLKKAGVRALATAKTTPLHEPLPDDFNKAWCPNVIEGIGQLTEWLGNL